MFPIATSGTIGAGGAGTITFSNIPQTFAHLQLRLISRATFNNGAFGTSLYMQFNGSGTNYGWRHNMQGNGTSFSAGGGALTTEIWLPSTNADAGGQANYFGPTIIDILDYSSSAKSKVVKGLGGFDNGNAANFGTTTLASASWNNTNAITSFSIRTDGNFVQYSRIDVYGIGTSGTTGA